MSITRSSSSIIKDKVKTIDIVSFLGFNTETLPRPESVGINRYAFELFFENSLKPEIGKFALTSDHIEHGFQIFAEKSEELPKLKEIINHLFLFAFTEILFADGPARSNLFLERQGDKCTLSAEELRQLVDLDPEMTDSVSTIFNHLVAPMNVQLDADFFQEANKIFNSAPAVSFLLRHFLHDEVSEVSLPQDHVPEASPRDLELIVQDDSVPEFFTEASAPSIQQPTNPYAEFRMMGNYPTIHINQPKYIPPPLPSLTCVHVPKHAEFCAASRSTAAAVFSVDTQLYYVCENEDFKELVPHTHSITCVTMSKCGKWVLSCDSDGGILLQNVDKTRHFFYLSARSLVTCCSIAPLMPHQFAVGLVDGSALLYDTASKKPIRMFVGHTAPIVAIDIHPNSEFIATVALDGMIRVWSATSGQCVRLIKAAGPTPTCVKISHNGHWIFTASTSGDIAIADLGSGRTFKSTKLASYVVCADFSPNDEIIACFDSSSNFLVWETRELQNDLPSFIQIDRTRVMALEYLSGSEVRVVSCQK